MTRGHPPTASTASQGVAVVSVGLAARPVDRLTDERRRGNIPINTPAMPLTEAHFGGFFVSGGHA